MGERAAFVLNLDADLELGSETYSPTRAVRAAIREHAKTLAATLLREGDVLVDEATPAGACEGFVGRAFSPTPRAIALLRHVGADVPESPGIEVLRRVSRRDFAYLHELPRSFVADDADHVIRHLHREIEEGAEVRLKRAIGMAGRGHRVVRGRVTEHDESFVRASRGLVVEPNVAITLELSLHGFVDRSGRTTRGSVVRSEVDASGTWRSTTALDPGVELAGDVGIRLHESLADAGDALSREGYFGPFGIDAYVYRDRDRQELRSRSEINARYSMGWAIGMASNGTRPDFDR